MNPYKHTHAFTPVSTDHAHKTACSTDHQTLTKVSQTNTMN